MSSALPPDLMALLGGGSAPAAGPAAPADAGAPSPAAGADAQAAEGDAVQYIKEMIDSAKKYLDVEPDEEDKATMAKVLHTLQQYLAKDQAEADGALQGKASPRLMRKAAGGPAA